MSYVGTSGTTYGPTTNAPTAAGSYAVTAFTEGDANNTSGTSDPDGLLIESATATVSATGGTFTYDGAPHGGSGTATGGFGENLTVTLSYVGVDVTTYGPTAEAPTVAGTYTVTASTEGDGNNASASSGPADLTINLANPVYTSVSSVTNSYGVTNIILTGELSGTGPVYPANGDVVVATVNEVSVSGTVTNDTGGFWINYTNTAPIPSLAVLGTNAPPYYRIIYSYAGNGSVSLGGAGDSSTWLTITQATPVITWNTPGDIAYGNEVDETELNATAANYYRESVSGTFTYDPESGTRLNAGGSQGLTVTFTPADTTNYTTATATVNINVQKAYPEVSATGGTFAYDGTQQGGSADATGGLGEELSLTLTFAGIDGTTYGPTTTAPSAAGTYTATATTGGDENNNSGSSGPIALTINQATPSVGVTGGTFTYDGNPHGGSGGATGGANESLPVTLSYVGASSTSYGPTANAPTAAGTYTVTASTVGDANNTSGSSEPAALTINLATPVMNVTGGTFTYDGNPHAGSGGATGGGGSNLPVTLSYVGVSGTSYGPTANAPTAAGIYTVTASTAGNSNNAADSSDPVALVINHAGLTVMANSTSKVYGASITFTGAEFTHDGTVFEGDTLTSVTLNSSGAAGPAVEGAYPIVPCNAVGNGLSNYNITYVNGTLTVHALAPTVVSFAPASQTNDATTTATFSVSVIGSASATNYQWLKITPTATNTLTDGGNISGSTGSVLTIANVLGADQAVYAVTITNLAGSVTTNGTLVVNDPAILTQPASVTTNLGGNVTFSVRAVGTAALTYQWQQDGFDLPGKTDSSLTIDNAQDSDAGDYTVVVVNGVSEVTSTVAALTLTHPPVIVAQPASLTVNQGTTVNFAVSVNGLSPFSYQWKKNGADLPGATSKKLILGSVSSADAASYQVAITNGDGGILSAAATLTVILPPAIIIQPVGLTNDVGTTAQFTAIVNGTAPAYQWFKVTAGATNALNDSGNISGSTSNVLTLASIVGVNGGGYYLVASNQAGVAISSNATLVVNDPVITNNPASLVVNLGNPASLSVGAYGSSLHYQWYKDGTGVSGAIAATYALAHAADADQGSYSVVVTNLYRAVTSTPPAILTVIDPPVITIQPLSRTNNAGTSASFTVSATGTAPGYQWYKGLTAITGATAATLTLANVQDADVASYSVALTNAAGTATSANASLTVIDAPVITVQPLSRTNNAGTSASFTVSATGTAPGYQWYKGLTAITGATTATLTLANVQDADVASYSVVLTNAAGTATSANASLTVIDAPVITVQPLSRTNNAGTSATFTVSANGTSPLAYQWYKVTPTATNALSNLSNISGATSNVLTIVNLLAADQASYSVTITNPAGMAISSNAQLVVIDPVILVQPVGSTNLDGSTVTLSVTAAGTTALNYQWYQDGVLLAGDTGGSLTLANITDGDAGHYTVVVNNSVSSVTSTPALLVTVAPLITTQPADVRVLQGQPASFGVSVAGLSPFHYQWSFNGTSIANATNRVYAINRATNSTDAGIYQVTVINPLGNQTSQVATLTVDVPPSIVTQPVSVIALAGQTVNLSVTGGGVPLFYQWHLNTTNLPAGHAATLTLNNVTTNNAGTYFVTITNIGGTVNSVNVSLAVYPNAIPTVTVLSYSNRQATVKLAGVPSYNYAIEASSNLLDWVTLSTNSSPFTVTDTNRFVNQFYRGHYLP